MTVFWMHFRIMIPTPLKEGRKFSSMAVPPRLSPLLGQRLRPRFDSGYIGIFIPVGRSTFRLGLPGLKAARFLVSLFLLLVSFSFHLLKCGFCPRGHDSTPYLQISSGAVPASSGSSQVIRCPQKKTKAGFTPALSSNAGFTKDSPPMTSFHVRVDGRRSGACSDLRHTRPAFRSTANTPGFQPTRHSMVSHA